MAAKLVLVTGASSGIGAATARRYGASGARVLLLARNAERLGAVADAIRREGGAASVFPVDLSDALAIEEASARITREAGTPDILINNAGAGRWLPLIETTPQEARAMIEVPYLAAFTLTRAVLPAMLARRSGAIACITSPASYLTWPNASAYIAARHALAGFTAALRSEVKGKGVDRDPRRAWHGREPLLGAQPGKPGAPASCGSPLGADALARRGRGGDLCGRRAAKANRGEARHLSRSLPAQCACPRPCRKAASARLAAAVSSTETIGRTRS